MRSRAFAEVGGTIVACPRARFARSLRRIQSEAFLGIPSRRRHRFLYRNRFGRLFQLCQDLAQPDGFLPVFCFGPVGDAVHEIPQGFLVAESLDGWVMLRRVPRPKPKRPAPALREVSASQALARVSKNGRTYFLCGVRTRRGVLRLLFCRTARGIGVAEVPAGYRVTETARGIPSLLAIRPRALLESEIAAVMKVFNRRELAPFRLEIRPCAIHVSEPRPESPGLFRHVLRFDLVHITRRDFKAARDGSRSRGLGTGSLESILDREVAWLLSPGREFAGSPFWPVGRH